VEEGNMERAISVPELAVWTATRVAAGIGIGLLLARHMNNEERKAAGLALISVGGVTTVPLAISILGKKNAHRKLRFVA
jgi:hypothetical protein